MEFKTWNLDVALDSRGNNDFIFHQISVKLFHLSLLSFSLASYDSVNPLGAGVALI